MVNSFRDSGGSDIYEENVGSDELAVTNDGVKTTLLPPTGDYLRIGDAGTTSHTLNANDDLLVSGELEVDGASYLDSDTTITGALTATGDISLRSKLIINTSIHLRDGIIIENIDSSVQYGRIFPYTDDGLHFALGNAASSRSEERRVGKECRSRWSPYH